MTDTIERLYRLESELCQDDRVSVVCYQWNEPGFSEQRGFEPEQVNVLARKVRENLSLPHRFICITDETQGFSDDVEVMPLTEEARLVAKIPTAENRAHFPSCYRRLWTFSESAKVLGDAVLVLDIDCFILKSLDPFFEYMPDADFVGWNPRMAWGETKIGGGTWRHRPGSMTYMWDEFSIEEAARIRGLGYRGSDQAILSYRLGDKPVFPQGWVSNAQDMRRIGGGKAPPGTKILHFNGRQKSWDLMNLDWVQAYYEND